MDKDDRREPGTRITHDERRLWFCRARYRYRHVTIDPAFVEDPLTGGTLIVPRRGCFRVRRPEPAAHDRGSE